MVNMLIRTCTLVVMAASLLFTSRAEAQSGRVALDEGIRLMRSNEAAKAERQFEKAITAEPNVGVYHLWLGRAVSQQVASAGVIRQPILARRIKSAFERAVDLDPTLLDARDGLVQFYLQAPGIMGGSVDKAREQQREIAQRDVVRGHLAGASIAWHSRDTVATERALRAAMTAAPDSAVTSIQLAQRQAGWGRTAAAFATLDAFLARHPDDIAVRYQFGRLAGLTGDQLARGETMLRGLIASPDWEPTNIRPSRAVVHFRLGTVLERAGRLDDARKAYRSAIALDQNLKAAKDALAALK